MIFVTVAMLSFALVAESEGAELRRYYMGSRWK
jgi:hypothetical protein